VTIHGAPLPADTSVPAFDLATGQEACERLLSIDGLPEEVDLQTRRRMVAFAPALRDLLPGLEMWTLSIPMPGGWSLLDPSIAYGPDRLRMIVRSTNWSCSPSQGRAINDASGIARDRLFLIELDDNCDVRHIQTITERLNERQPSRQPVSGFGAARLMRHQGDWWIAAVARGLSEDTPRHPLLGRLNGPWLTELCEPRHNLADTGWIPILDQPGTTRDFAFLASLFPTAILRYDPAAERIERDAPRTAPLIARKLVAESAVVPCDGGHLCLAREAVDFAGGEERAVHRWVWFDRAWQLTRLSRPFVVPEQSAGWIPGLARVGDTVLVSFGAAAREVWVASIPLSSVMSILTPPLELDLEATERQLESLPGIVPNNAPRAMKPVSLPPPSGSPTIVSMTMTGSNRDIVADALRSVVDWVDWCLLIDTGIDDDTIEVARSVVGDKLIVRHFPWCNDFSAARNFSLAAAAEIGADWAVTIDSDERIHTHGVDVRAALATSNEVSIYTPYATGDYTKDRFFRLPADGLFKGPTHEAFYRNDGGGGATVGIPGVVFDELVKSEERFRHKDERDVAILTRHIENVPDEPRWPFYLGNSLQRLGKLEEAVAAFRACAALRGWEEESAWAHYRAAECLFALGRVEEALESCAQGLTRHAGLADLSWYAAYLSLKLGRAQQAVYWARLSIAMGYFEGIGPSIERIAWRYPFGLWEGPYDVLRFALRQLNDESGAAEAERLYHEAAAARERYHATR
jgi:hypothetical protein